MEDALASYDRKTFSCTVPVFVPHPEAEVACHLLAQMDNICDHVCNTLMHGAIVSRARKSPLWKLLSPLYRLATTLMRR